MYAVAAAGALGYAEKTGMKLPVVFGLSPAASVGLITWAIGRFTHSRTAEHLATGLLSVAANRWASGTVPGGAVIGFDDDYEG